MASTEPWTRLEVALPDAMLRLVPVEVEVTAGQAEARTEPDEIRRQASVGCAPAEVWRG